jgi:hypothetical protein
MKFEIEPAGFVSAQRTEAEDDNWRAVESRILLADGVPTDALAGILAQRGRNRPNRPRAVRQPAWSTELMREYWSTPTQCA